LRHAPANPAT